MTCAKQVVKAVIVAIDGSMYSGENGCANPKDQCPREAAGYPSFHGYHLCKSVCEQEGHAEVMAIRDAGVMAEGATLYLEGHHAACPDCVSACDAAGIARIVVI